MIASDLRTGVERLGDMIASASTIVPFTGAGISTECGIPDFRSPGGLWTRNRPIPFDEFVASRDARDRYRGWTLSTTAPCEARTFLPRARGQRSETRDQRPETRRRKSEIRLKQFSACLSSDL